MIRFIRYLYIILLFFVGSNVCLKFAIDLNLFAVLLLFLALISIVSQVNKLYLLKGWFPLFLFITFYGAFKIFTDTGAGTRTLVLNIIAPMLLIAAFPMDFLQNREEQSKITKIFFLFFLIEVGIAITERIIGFNIFPWANDDLFLLTQDGATDFRSTSLHGHPLQNALIVSTCMSFILISNLSFKKKIIFWFAGFLAVACFNTRAALVGNILLFVTYVVFTIFYNKRENVRIKRNLLITLVIAALLIPVVALKYNLGGRLIENGLMDSSSQVRLDVWGVFDYFEIENFLLGFTFNEVELIMYKVGLFATENFWLDWLFRLGLCYLIPAVILYFCFVKKLYKGYVFFNAAFTSLTFLLIASTNNSLSASYVPLSIYLICIKIFNPSNKSIQS